MNDPATLEYAERFRRDGFVHVTGLLPRDDIGRLGAAVDEAVFRRKRHDTRRLEDKTPYERSFIQCQYLWEDSPDVRPLTFHPRITAIAAALLGVERLRLWHDQALYKEPGGRETEAHQDHPYWPIAGRDAATAWIPLQPVDHTIGCMGYVPGSHLGEAEFVDIFRSPGAGRALERKQIRPPVFVPCDAGDVIFHHGFTVHQAKPNTSAHTRRVYTAIYFRDGCTRSSGDAHPSVDRDHIAPGAVIDGAATPLVRPLPDGRLPDPKPWPETSSATRRRYEQLGIIPPSRS